jgi:hypothetical protein
MKVTHKNPFPLQPLVKDERGTVRFRANAIVKWLLDAKLIDMNRIATMQFDAEDREQFAMLIGYSLSGFSELSYVSDETVLAAELMAKDGESEAEARNTALRDTIAKAKDGMRQGVAELFGMHPDDLGGEE